MDEDIYLPYSKRLKREEQGDRLTAYIYEPIPISFRHQVGHIWQRALGVPLYVADSQYISTPIWVTIERIAAEEGGVRTLAATRESAFESCMRRLINGSTMEALDLVEISFRYLDNIARKFDRYEAGKYNVTQRPDDAIADLNRRFREHGLGYQFSSDKLVRIDSEFLHIEVVNPAIILLHDAKFRGPSDEFMRAHEHYRHGRVKEAIRDANNAFESTMKAICDARGWVYDPTAPAKKLVSRVLDEGLIPQSLQNQLNQFASLMEALPTVRNKMGGHGQGAEVIDVPEYFAAHALHLAAANIVLLVEAYRALP